MLILLLSVAFAADPNVHTATTAKQNYIDIQKVNIAIQNKYGIVPLRNLDITKVGCNLFILQTQWSDYVSK